MGDTIFPEHRSTILHTRGIADEVADYPGRYASFEAGDHERFFDLMRIDTRRWPREKLASWKGKVTLSGGGIVIGRFSRTEAPLPPYARLVNDVYFGDPAQGNSPLHYAYRPGYSVKHIDIHPAQPEYETGRYGEQEPTDIFFCLEGSLKADAVLSAKRTVFSSTSVTTWESKDLKALLPLLRTARTVFVVPDSDYFASDKFQDPDTEVCYFNPSVLYFTRLAAQWLADRDVPAKIAVPWTMEAREGNKLGIDDYLARGYALEDLTLEDPYANELLFMPAMKLTPSEDRVLRYLLRHQGRRGAFKVGDLARRLKIHRDTVLEAYKRFEQLRLMRVWEGKAYEIDEHFRTRPHMYLMYELIEGYGDWLRTIRVPLPTRNKLQMDEWSARERRDLEFPFRRGRLPNPV